MSRTTLAAGLILSIALIGCGGGDVTPSPDATSTPATSVAPTDAASVSPSEAPTSTPASESPAAPSDAATPDASEEPSPSAEATPSETGPEVPGSSDPESAVRTSISLLEAGNLDGFIASVCSEARESARQSFDFSSALGPIAQMVDRDAVSELFSFSFDVEVTEQERSETDASVALNGEIQFGVDQQALKDLIRQEVEKATGRAPTDDELSEIVEAFGSSSDREVDSVVRVSKEADGTWKMCGAF